MVAVFSGTRGSAGLGDLGGRWNRSRSRSWRRGWRRDTGWCRSRVLGCTPELQTRTTVSRGALATEQCAGQGLVIERRHEHTEYCSLGELRSRLHLCPQQVAYELPVLLRGDPDGASQYGKQGGGHREQHEWTKPLIGRPGKKRCQPPSVPLRWRFPADGKVWNGFIQRPLPCGFMAIRTFFPLKTLPGSITQCKEGSRLRRISQGGLRTRSIAACQPSSSAAAFAGSSCGAKRRSSPQSAAISPSEP